MNHQSSAVPQVPFVSKLSLKLITVIGLTVLVIQLIFIAYFGNSSYQAELGKAAQQQKLFTEANAIYLAEEIDDENEQSQFLILSAIVANPFISGARLDYVDGRFPMELGDLQASMVYAFEIMNLGENDELVPVGTLTTVATTELIDEIHSQRFGNLLLLAMLVFIAIIAISWFSVQYLVGAPLRRIMRTMEIESGEQVPLIAWESRDELGAVVQRLNFLHTKLNDRVSGLEKELDETERREVARISNLANATMEGILILEHQCIRDLNHPMAAMLGNDREEIRGAGLEDLFDESVQEFLNQTLERGKKATLETVLESVTGKLVPVMIYLDYLGDESDGSRVAVVRDESTRIEAEKVMWKMAHHDSLTDLPNRRYFSECLDNAVIEAQANEIPLSIAYLDLDNFKLINDSKGHDVGDQLLSAVGCALRAVCTKGEICARLGGDEFAVILEPGTDFNTVSQRMTQIVDEIQTGKACSEWTNLFSVSAGVATLTGKSIDTSELLKMADLALYNAKQNGRARISYYSSEIDDDLKRQKLLVSRLARAIDEDLLELHYQPQVLCDGTTLVGFEALLRWTDDELGQVRPDELVAAAEREGMIAQLGRWVIDHACAEAANWPETIRVAINLSPTELTDSRLVEYVEKALKRTGLSAGRLEIELTETALVTDAEKTLRVIEGFKSLGITIALDDFGTGYSSLNMLQNFPFDRIKIDRSFVSNTEVSTEAGKQRAAIVTTVVELGQRLGLDVIAEGVECHSDLEMLRDLNCRECQGFLISKPIPAVDLLPWMSDLSKININKIYDLENYRRKAS